VDCKAEKHLLCQTVSKYCYRVLLRATVVTLVICKLIPDKYRSLIGNRLGEMNVLALTEREFTG